jgi:type IV secretory pathway protease TraF
LVILALNDHFFKGSGYLPSILTGKLSDFCGLFFFPLLCTACFDVLLSACNALLGRCVFDASLRTRKLVISGLATAAFFSALKINAAFAAHYVALIEHIDVANVFPPARIVQDLSDLVALPMIALAVVFGRSRIAKIPPGRLIFIIAKVRAGMHADRALRFYLDDLRYLSKRPKAAFDALIHALTPYVVVQARRTEATQERDRALRALAAWRT